MAFFVVLILITKRYGYRLLNWIVEVLVLFVYLGPILTKMNAKNKFKQIKNTSESLAGDSEEG